MNPLNSSPFFNRLAIRRSWHPVLCLCALGSFLSAPLSGAQSDWLNLGIAGQEQERYTIRFSDVAVQELIHFVSRISGKNFIYDPAQINFKITIVSDEPATSEEVLSMLLQIMRLNQFLVTEEGSNILLYRTEQSATSLSPVLGNGDKQASGLVTRVFNLRYASAQAVAEVITKLATDPSRVALHPSARQIIVSDLASNIERIGQLITALDQIDSDQEIDLYKVKHSNLAALKSFAEQVLAPIVGSGSTDSAGSKRQRLSLIPNPSANSLFIIGSRQLIDRALGVLSNLDIPSELGLIAKSRENQALKNAGATDPSQILDPQINPEFYIYKLQYHPGDEILASLREISSSLLKGTPGGGTVDAPLLVAMQSIQLLKSTNSLLFTGDDATIIKLRNLIQSLDTPVKQVFIEALVVDTSISNAQGFGVEIGSQFLWGAAKIGGTIGNFSPKDGSFANALHQNFQNGGTPPSPPPIPTAGNFAAGVIGSAITHNGRSFSSIGALVTAFKTDQNTRIVLNPKIITEDNTPCHFFVGQEVRVKSGIVQNSGNNNVTTSNFETRDVGTTLRMTPIISNDELVTLIVEQETSIPLKTDNAGDSSVTVALTSTSRTQTRLHVPDRNFVILSGMVNDIVEGGLNRVPLLSSIPVLGALFRSRNEQVTRRNLLFFIRPHIIRTAEEAHLLTDRHRDLVRQNKFLPRDMEKQLRLLGNEQIAPAMKPSA